MSKEKSTEIVPGVWVTIETPAMTHTGVVHSAINHGEDDQPNWYIELRVDAVIYYWKQGIDGGVVSDVRTLSAQERCLFAVRAVDRCGCNNPISEREAKTILRIITDFRLTVADFERIKQRPEEIGYGQDGSLWHWPWLQIGAMHLDELTVLLNREKKETADWDEDEDDHDGIERSQVAIDASTFIAQADRLLAQLEQWVRQLPQRGDKTAYCQRLTILAELTQAQNAIHAVVDADFIIDPAWETYNRHLWEQDGELPQIVVVGSDFP